MSQDKTLFQKIIDGEIPGEFLYRDDSCVVIQDKYPDAPVHLLVIPHKPIKSIAHLEEEDAALVAHMVMVAKKMAKEQECKGYKLLFNVGEKGGQVVFHLHLHLMGWR
ncbi:MAG: histidine triad (HIT) family protein [Oceanicoccus sp.]|jgi:histidine triad (HIT) family protein